MLSSFLRCSDFSKNLTFDSSAGTDKNSLLKMLVFWTPLFSNRECGGFLGSLLFNRLPATLFQPLAAAGSAFYARCLEAFFELSKEQGEPPTRDRLIESVLALSEPDNEESKQELSEAHVTLENEEPLYGLDDSSSEIEKRVLKAGAVVRYLTRCGWLQVEMHSDFSQRFIFPEGAFRILETLSEISGKGSRDSRFQGLICSIHDLLKAACDQGQGHVRVVEAENQLQNLLSQLRELQHNIGQFLERVLKADTANETLSVFFNGYSSEVMEKSYHQLRTTDHLSRYRPNIEESLQLLTEQAESVPPSSLLRQASLSWGCDNEVARARLLTCLSNCAESLVTLDALIGSIDHRHGLFVDAAVRTLERKILGQSTVSGVLSGSLKALINGVGSLIGSDVGDTQEGEEGSNEIEKQQDLLLQNALSSCIELTAVQHLSSESLSKPRRPTVHFEVSKDTTRSLTKKQVAAAKAKTILALDRNLGKERIKKIADVLLDLRDPTLASEIQVKGPEDLALLVYLRAYGTGELDYVASTVEPKTWIHKCDIGFFDFEIRRISSQEASKVKRRLNPNFGGQNKDFSEEPS